MKSVQSNVFLIPIRIVRNTSAASPNDHWAKIVRADTRQVLHTGQIGYIRRVARTRYNVKAEI